MPNFIPTYAFSNIVDGVTKGKATLEKIILSEKIKNIEDAAFKGCENLKICQIRKKTAPNRCRRHWRTAFRYFRSAGQQR